MLGVVRLLLASSCADLVSQLQSLEPLCLHSTVGSQDLSDVLSHPSEMTWITFIPVLSLFREKRGKEMTREIKLQRKKCDWEGWQE